METEKIDKNRGQRDSNLLAALMLSALLIDVGEVSQTTFEPDGGPASTTAVHCDRLLGSQSCQQPGRRDASWCTGIL